MKSKHTPDEGESCSGNGGLTQPLEVSSSRRDNRQGGTGVLTKRWKWLFSALVPIALGVGYAANAVGLVADVLDIRDGILEPPPAPVSEPTQPALSVGLSAPSPEPAAGLRSARLAAIDHLQVSQHGVVDVTAFRLGESGNLGTQKFPSTRVTVTLRNEGDVAVGFYELRAHVLSAAALSSCYTAGSEIGTTAKYKLPLPQPKRGESETVPISWEVRGRRNDAFSLTLGAPWAAMSTQVPLYRLELSLRQGDGKWLTSGPILVASEIPHYGSFLDEEAPEYLIDDCSLRNRKTLQSFLAQPGERSPELAAYEAAMSRPPDLEAFRPKVCRSGQPLSLQDMYPVSLTGESGDVRMALALRCGDDLSGVTTLVVTPGVPGGTALRYKPSLGPATDMSITGWRDSIGLTYTRGSGSNSQTVSEKVVLKDGRLVTQSAKAARID